MIDYVHHITEGQGRKVIPVINDLLPIDAHIANEAASVE
jgi:hypothetical protein